MARTMLDTALAKQMRGCEGQTLRGCVAAFVAAAALLGTRSAQAYCRSTTCDARLETCAKDEKGCPRVGAPLSWRQLPLVYRFHAGGSGKLDMDAARAAIRSAFQTWTGVICGGGKHTSLRFKEGTDIPGTNPLAGEGPAAVPFGIYFRDTVWPYSDGEESLALTNQTYGKINGYIDYSDIEVNTSAREFSLTDTSSGKIDLQAVITHEVGHYIGLAHSLVPTSIMVASYCESADRCGTSIESSRALADDDTAAVCALYPPSGIAGIEYEDPGAKGCSVTPASGSSSLPASFAVVGGLALALTAARRRSFRRASG